MRYFLQIAYKGTRYHGWQRQPDVISVQQVMEECLEKILKRKTVCLGCGRTDAGVHASQYYLHIDTSEKLPKEFHFVLNKVLPDDIALYKVFPVNDHLHAQFSVHSRTYEYYFHTRKDPFLTDNSTLYLGCQFDLQTMHAAVSLLPSHSDFRAFCKTPDRHDSTLCEVYEVSLRGDETKDQFLFKIRANRFLRGMIRLLIGNIVEIGLGKLSLEDFEECLIKGQVPKYHLMAPPQGLHLTAVDYGGMV